MEETQLLINFIFFLACRKIFFKQCDFTRARFCDTIILRAVQLYKHKLDL